MSSDVDIFASDPQATQQPTEQAITEPRPTRRSMLPWGVVAALALFIAWTYWPAGGITPGPAPVPIDGGPAVLFAITDGMTIGQAQVAASQRVQSWCDDNDVGYRRYDTQDDLSREDKSWRDMMDAAKAGQTPNMVTVDDAGNGSVRDIPDTVDRALQILESLK